MSLLGKRRLSYRLDLLPVIYPFHRRAMNELNPGDLVYYGPSPEYYGIGEIVQKKKVCVVDFVEQGYWAFIKMNYFPLILSLFISLI